MYKENHFNVIEDDLLSSIRNEIKGEGSHSFFAVQMWPILGKKCLWAGGVFFD